MSCEINLLIVGTLTASFGEINDEIAEVSAVTFECDNQGKTFYINNLPNINKEYTDFYKLNPLFNIV